MAGHSGARLATKLGFSRALPLGLVDDTVRAVTDVWSGLRLVRRKERR